MQKWRTLSSKVIYSILSTTTIDIHDIHYDDIYQQSEIKIPRSVRFWIFLFFNTPSILCSLFLLFHLLCNKNFREQLLNHAMIVLLIGGLLIEMINIPLHLTFFHSNYVQPSTPALCLTWWFLDLGVYNGCVIIMAWGSVHRYLWAFHDQLFSNRNRRLVYHYLPLTIVLAYILVFYVVAIIFPPCTNTYDYMLPVCNDFPCYLNHPVFGVIDSIVNNILPVIIIVLFNFILVIRVYCQKRRLRQQNVWRRQRKMTIQLLCSSVLFLVPNMPLNIFILARLCGLKEDVGVDAQIYFDFLCYFVTFLYPFICLASVSELRKKINWRRLFLFERRHLIATVHPQPTAFST